MTAVVDRPVVSEHELDKYRGKWVAIKDGIVVIAGETPSEILRKVRDQDLSGWVLDRVPEDPHAIYIL